ncbi:MAG: hypothetical protein AB8G14_08350 [Ilumatobacter sp.]
MIYAPGHTTSSFGAALLGHPRYRVINGSIVFDGDDITMWPTNERAKAGLLFAAAHPQPVPGISVVQLLQQALSTAGSNATSVLEVRQATLQAMQRLAVDPSMIDQPLDHHMSSHRRHQLELTQLAVLQPTVAIVETDASTDFAMLRSALDGLDGGVIITDQQPPITGLEFTHVHRLIDGRITPFGTPTLTRHDDRDRFASLQAAGTS